MAFIERDITRAVLAATSDIPVVVITGMRQTGKSTFLKLQPDLKEWRYVTFDDLSVLSAAREDPEGFVDSDKPLIIDEAQRFPDIFVAIKRIVVF